MTDVNDRMKVNVMTIPSEDALQLALDRYDSEPDPKAPKKLLSTKPVDLVAVSPDKLPKHFGNRNLIDLNLSELLNISMLGQYFQHKDKSLYNVIPTIEDVWQNQREHVISDGALTQEGKSSRMTVQQVLAQNIIGKNKSRPIKEVMAEVIEEKNARMRRGDYPKDSALLVAIYTDEQNIDFGHIIANCDLKAFGVYYTIQYRLPDLDQCIVNGFMHDVTPDKFNDWQEKFELVRYENPYGSSDE